MVLPAGATQPAVPDCGKMTGESHEAHRVLEPWRVRYREVFGKADLSEPTSIGELLPAEISCSIRW